MIKKKIKINVPMELEELVNIFSQKNATLYVVGGFVRDSLINKPIYDIDICSNLTLDQVKELLDNTKFNIEIKNKKFGTAQISLNNISFEYTCFRRETYDLTGSHSPKKIEFISSLTLDALRRDFYVNALYYNPKTYEVLDPLNKGLKDLETKTITLIKSNPNKFLEDATRIIRMFKFSVLLNFEIDMLSLKYAKQYKQLLKNISKARIEKETEFLNYCTTEQQLKFYNYLKKCEIDL